MTYIADDAPLAVNIADEVRRETIWPLSGDAPEASIFDGAQEHIYSIIKNHSFPRFEKSAIYNNYLQYCDMENQVFTAAKSLWSFNTVFSGNDKLDQVLDISEILMYPESDLATTLLEKFCGGPVSGVSSDTFRKCLLSATINRYMPMLSPCIGLYFDRERRKTWSMHRMKVKKHKKLTKFFGERPTLQDMLRQQSYPELSSHTDDKQDSVASRSDMHEFKHIYKRESLIEAFNGAEKVHKAGKLNAFFGDRLTNTHLFSQNLLEEPDETSDEQKPDTQEPGSNKEKVLTPAQKRELQRRARKLQSLLGGSFSGPPMESYLADIPAFSENVLSEVITEDEELESHDEETSNQHYNVFDFNTEFSQTAHPERLEVLSFCLGYGNSDSMDLQTNPTTKKRITTLKERKTLQKRATKLNRLLGNAVPADYIMLDTGSMSIKEQS